MRGISSLWWWTLLFLLAAPFLQINGRVKRNILGPDGVVSKVRAGLNMAGKLLGLDTAQGVANLVTSSLAKSARALKEERPGIEQGIFAGFFRILGFDSTKLGAIALNALIFMAQLISTALTNGPKGPENFVDVPPSTDYSSDSPITWFFENPSTQMMEIMSRAQDRSLPDTVVDTIRSKAPEEETVCIQLLVCKTAPFVWGMQRSLTALLRQERWPPGLTPVQRMYAFLPSAEDVKVHGDACESKFPHCQVIRTL